MGWLRFSIFSAKAKRVLNRDLATKCLDAGVSFLTSPGRSWKVIEFAAGGVNQQTAAYYILAGATAIGVGTELIPTEAIERRQAKRIRELALRFSGFLKEARERTEPKKKTVPAGKLVGIEECERK